jgi:DNA polymerase-3 subunit delta'
MEVVGDLRLTSTTGRRVVIIYEVDRFQAEAANCFLKTLEEPPAGTLIIMQTTNYYRVLPTVLSRSLRFHLGGEKTLIQDASWNNWLKDFENFINRLITSKSSQNRSTEIIIPLYSLCARFEVLLQLFLDEALEKLHLRHRLMTKKKNLFLKLTKRQLGEGFGIVCWLRWKKK